MPEPQRLWDGVAPGSEDWSHEEQAVPSGFGGASRVRNVVTPTITHYEPDEPTDRAVVVLPGGAMHFLSMDTEGDDVAVLIRQRGIAAFVVKYRLVPTPDDDDGFNRAVSEAFVAGLEASCAHVLPLAAADLERALALVRQQGYNTVTVLGFSAGARVALRHTLTTEDPPSALALVYLATSGTAVATESAPPVFVAAAADDPLGIDGSLSVHAMWRAAGRPIELHLFERGGHGFGLGPDDLPCHHWFDMLLEWMP